MNGKGGTHMAVMTFAAIDIGSYEVSMKIFEMSKRIGFRELNDVRFRERYLKELHKAGLDGRLRPLKKE